MAVQALILDELHRLRARVPQVTGALAASVDGLVLAHDAPGVEQEGLAALTAAALGVSVRIADATGRGELRELLVRGARGYVATYAAGRGAVLTLLAEDHVNVGRLHLEGRRAGTRIGELVDTAPAPREAVPAAPARSDRTRQKPVRAPRAPRTPPTAPAPPDAAPPRRNSPRTDPTPPTPTAPPRTPPSPTHPPGAQTLPAGPPTVPES